MRLILAAFLLMACCQATLAEVVPPVDDIQPRWDVNQDGRRDIVDVLTLQLLDQIDAVDLEVDYNDDLEITYHDVLIWLHQHNRELGDFNWDGVADDTDIWIINLHYNLQPPPYRYYGEGDVSGDGVVNSTDINILMIHNPDFLNLSVPSTPMHEDVFWAWLELQVK